MPTRKRGSLKRCPFCEGTKLATDRVSQNDPIADGFQVGCKECHATGPILPTPTAAATGWNGAARKGA